MRCFDTKRSNKFSQNCAACWRPNYTFSLASFNFTFVTRDFLCSLLLLHCASFVLFKLLFSFFLMTFSVSTVHFSKFILFGGKQIILHSCRSLGPFQTPLHSCAEPNSVRFDIGATLERQLIQTAYLCRT